MNAFILAAGIVIVLVTLVDFVWTTLTLNGSGPLSRYIPWAIWGGLVRLAKVVGSFRVLALAGPLAVLGLFCFWFLFIWLGWTLIFYYEMAALRDEPVDANAFWGLVHYVGFTLSSLGVSSYETSSNFWRVLTAVAGVSGLSVLTLGVTYILSVISAVTAGRAVAAGMPNRELSAEELVAQTFDGEGFEKLLTWMRQWTPALFSYSQQRLAFPVIDFFWSESEQTAIAPAVAQLDEILLLLKHGVGEEHRPPVMEIEELERAVTAVLNAVRWSRAENDADPPSAPDLAQLERAGVPVVDGSAFAEAVQARSHRRARLLSWVSALGWEWRASGREAAPEKNAKA